MQMLEWEIKRLDGMYDRVLDELYPDLKRRVLEVLIDLDGRFTPYCGFRDAAEQADAKKRGASNADFGSSFHNFFPALACDVVLNPAVVGCRPHADDARFPDLWDDGMPRTLSGVVDGGNSEALLAWRDLEGAAAKHGLVRVNIAPGKRDWPHLQHPDAAALIVGRKPGR
jgi:hypothetical protein